MKKIKDTFKKYSEKISRFLLAIIFTVTVMVSPRSARADLWGGDGVPRMAQV